jgi:hypothetical protein
VTKVKSGADERTPLLSEDVAARFVNRILHCVKESVRDVRRQNAQASREALEEHAFAAIHYLLEYGAHKATREEIEAVARELAFRSMVPLVPTVLVDPIIESGG